MQGRLDHIHGLRGLAAVAVVIEHAALIARASGASLFSGVLHAIDLGRFGVVLFFLISGLVIPFSFSGETPLRTFAIRRAFRLYPVYWLSIPVLALVGTAGGYVRIEATQVVPTSRCSTASWATATSAPDTGHCGPKPCSMYSVQCWSGARR